MNISFLGAAQTVTGSCYIIEAAGARFSVDCGMHQGNPAIESRNADTVYEPARLDFVLLTHAHIDHSGLLPRMAKEGFNGPIYCTAPTQDLVNLMLEDSAHIQEMEYEWKSQHCKRKGSRAAKEDEPLYSVADAKKASEQTRAVEWQKCFEPHPGIRVTYLYAGHILGAAMIELEIMENGISTRLFFSGDLGRPQAMLLGEPVYPTNPPDYLFMESTYGDRDHRGEADTLEELAAAIKYSYTKREKVIIPTFAVERAQEILYSLALLHEKQLIPADMPIYLDSPLAIRATEVFNKYAEQLKTPELGSFQALDNAKYNIHYAQTTAESQALNAMKGPAIILSASGMCTAGRIKHHLKHNIWKPGASIVFVGYQAVGTLGRAIVDGAKIIHTLGQPFEVAAKVFTINGFSAHAGQSQLLEWLGHFANPNLQVILIHGEPAAQRILADLIHQKFHLDASIPDFMEQMELHPGKLPLRRTDEAKARPQVDWDFWKEEMEHHFHQVLRRIDQAQSLSWEKQTDLRDRIHEIDQNLTLFLSER